VAALDRLSGADVFDLGALRPVVEAADPEGRLAPIGLQELRIGTGLLEELADVLERLGVQGRVLVAGDDTTMRDAGGRDVKAAALEAVGARFEAAPVSLV
jgi:hypothetical protein